MYKWSLSPSAVSKCGADGQAADHIVIEQWFLTFSTPVTFIPKDIGLGTPPLRKLQRRYMMKG